MNWADLSFVATPLVCAFAAGAQAFEEKLGWASSLFVIGGVVLGMAFGILARTLGHRILFAGDKQSQPAYAFGVLLAYVLVPLIVLVGAGLFTAWLTYRLAQHI